jgi:hypothetical protein
MLCAHNKTGFSLCSIYIYIYIYIYMIRGGENETIDCSKCGLPRALLELASSRFDSSFFVCRQLLVSHIHFVFGPSF